MREDDKITLRKSLMKEHKSTVKTIYNDIEKSKKLLDNFIERPFTVEEAIESSRQLGKTLKVIDDTLDNWKQLKKDADAVIGEEQ